MNRKTGANIPSPLDEVLEGVWLVAEVVRHQAQAQATVFLQPSPPLERVGIARGDGACRSPIGSANRLAG